MSMSVSELQDYIREIIKQELEEASVTGALDGGEGPPKTPYAFYGGRKKDKEKKKKIAQAGGYMKVKESVDEAVSPKGWNMSKKFVTVLNREVKNLQKYHRQQNEEDFLEVANYMELQLKYMKKNLKESVNEGKYHQYKNDESMSPKQKIGKSMREVRDGLKQLEQLVKMNVKLKNELNVDSQSYWKNTHKALHKISERLVKLANKVGQLK